MVRQVKASSASASSCSRSANPPHPEPTTRPGPGPHRLPRHQRQYHGLPAENREAGMPLAPWIAPDAAAPRRSAAADAVHAEHGRGGGARSALAMNPATLPGDSALRLALRPVPPQVGQGVHVRTRTRTEFESFERDGRWQVEPHLPTPTDLPGSCGCARSWEAGEPASTRSQSGRA